MTREEWVRAYPGHCEACVGQGGTAYETPCTPDAPAEWDLDPCGDCIQVGLCPRCGGDYPNDEPLDYYPCPSCGWNWGRSEAGDDWPKPA